MPVTAELLTRYTYDDYAKWSGEGRWELIDGFLQPMSPAPNFVHQLVCSHLVVLLNAAFKGYSDIRVQLPIDLVLDERNVLQPDVSVFCVPVNELQKITTLPHLVIEVLSPSTLDRDRVVKRGYYRQAGIPFYLMVDPDEQTCTLLELRNGQYAEAAKTGGAQTYTFRLPQGEFKLSFVSLWLD
jgi:Uma2 family endonuclease